MIPGYGALAPDETVIKKKQLALLERKARDHDIYMAAMRRMRVKLESVGPAAYQSESWYLRAGYRAALEDFANMIVEEGRNV